MTDIVVAAGALQQAAAGVQSANYTAGEALTLGQPFYKNTDGKVYKADNNQTAAKAAVEGIAVHSCGMDETVRGHKKGGLDLGAALVVGTIYVLSAAGGGICPAADLAITNFTSIIGVATATDLLEVNIFNSGAQKVA